MFPPLAVVVLPVLLQAASVPDATTNARVLRLDDAVATALKNQPTIQQARAQTNAAGGRATQARAGLFPQLTAVASYQRIRSAGVGGRSGTATTTVGGAPSAITPSGTSGIDVFTFGGSATQLLWDFGATYNRSRAASRLVDAASANEKTASQNVLVDVRRSYFTARAQKALIGVARGSLQNFQQHLTQIEGFVGVGTRPEIDLAQARTDVANSRLQVIDAENAYAVAKAQLSRAIGLGGASDYEVADDELPPIDGEDLATDRLVARAFAARPELLALDKQREAYQLSAKAYRGQYGPALTASAGASETGTDLGDLGPAWSVGVNLNWPIFQGGLTHGQVREAEANADATRAQTDTQKLQIRVDVQQAQLDIRAAKASQVAAGEALTNARERLRLAEGRYASGVGSIIELGDAQVALTTAAAQVVQAQFRLSTARADLLAALGQR
ncbi:MAG: outer rane efflux protein [Labilithrix sp.]|nr:outer rane efflux protein [Labilithrix sp.]